MCFVGSEPMWQNFGTRLRLPPQCRCRLQLFLGESRPYLKVKGYEQSQESVIACKVKDGAHDAGLSWSSSRLFDASLGPWPSQRS
jgi:hypothetical protein